MRVLRMTSTAGTRPVSFLFGSRRSETIARRLSARRARTWSCSSVGKNETSRLIVDADVRGVDRGEDEVAGLGGLERRVDGLEVAHLADHDHVGVLAQRRAQRVREASRVSVPISRCVMMLLSCLNTNSIGSSTVTILQPAARG